MDKYYFIRYNRSPLLKNTFKMSMSNVVVFVSVILLTPIVSRLYSPEAYGEWGVFSNVLMICNCLVFLTYENAIVQSENVRDQFNLVSLCFILALLTSLLTYILFKGGAYIGIEFFKSFPSAELLGIILFLWAVYTLLTTLANRATLYNLISVITIIYGLAQPILRIFLGIGYMTNNSLIYSNLLTQIIGILCYVYGLRTVFSLSNFKMSSRGRIFYLIKKYKKYPLYEMPSLLTETFCACIVIIILSLYFKKTDIGCYTMILQLIVLPVSVVGTSLSKVFFRDLASIYEDNEKTKDLVVKTGKLGFLLGCIPILFLSLGGDYLVYLFLGEQWRLAGAMSLCMVAYSLPGIISEPLLPIFRSYNRQEIRFKFNILNLVTTFSSLFLGICFFDDVLKVILMYSLAYTFIRYVLLYSELRIVRLTMPDIHPQLVFISLLCYTILAVRLYFVL